MVILGHRQISVVDNDLLTKSTTIIKASREHHSMPSMTNIMSIKEEYKGSFTTESGFEYISATRGDEFRLS